MKTVFSSPTMWFILGREPKLSAAEILSLLSTKEYSFDAHIFKSTTKIDANKLIRELGGTIKIAEEMGKNLTEDDVLKLIINELKTIEGKIHFGLSLYSGPPQNHSSVGAIHEFSLQAWGKKIKKILKDQNRSVRYVENREPILSSVTVEKNGLTKRGREFLIQVATYGSEGPLAPTDRCFSLAKTTAVQPFEEWGKRDFGRPGRDDKSGMLPPKLATMMINLLGRGVGAIHELPLENAPGVLLDPFCGSGTILTEAHRLGYANLIGTDVSEKAVEDTKKNVEWTKNNEHALQNTEQFSIKIVPSASKNLSQTILACSVDGIVTEPFLGKPRTGRESRAELEKQMKELKNLYLETFTQFYKILKPCGRVVFIIPRFKYGNEWLTISCLEEIKKRGFKTIPLLPQNDFLLYARPNQYVGREIWRFEKI